MHICFSMRIKIFLLLSWGIASCSTYSCEVDFSEKKVLETKTLAFPVELTDTEIHSAISARKWLWSISTKRKQVNLFIKLQKTYGDQLGDYNTHISELSELVSMLSALLAESPAQNNQKLIHLFNNMKMLYEQKKLSFPRFKIFLFATQMLISSYEKQLNTQLLSDCKARPHKIWYISLLEPILKSAVDCTDILALEAIIKSLDKIITVNKDGKIRQYNNLIKQCVEDHKIIPLLGKTPIFGYVDANYAMLNGLRPFGVGFNKMQVHNTFHTEPIDIFMHDLIHVNYTIDVQEAYKTLKNEDGITFLDLLKVIYNDSFQESIEDYKKSQYCLFLLLHDPDPVQFNKLYQQLCGYRADLGKGLVVRNLTYDQFMKALKDLIVITLKKYSLTNKEEERYHPNELKVALMDVLKSLKEIEMNITSDQLYTLGVAHQLSELGAEQLKESLKEQLNSLFIKFFFSKAVLRKGYVVTFYFT